MATTQHEKRLGGVVSDAGALTVASVPSGHVYVRHLAPESGGGPRRLADPDPRQPDRPAGPQWWPPVMLDPSWVATSDVDLVHLHFGFDARTPEQLAAWADALAARDVPFVQTVHDLRNPHHPDRALHDAQMDVLVPAAAELVTLTPGAAGEIWRRWGRDALVLPHPHVVPFERIASRRPHEPGRGPFKVGVHLKSLRPNLDPAAVLPTLVDLVDDLPDAVLQVDVHCDVMSPTGAHGLLAARLCGWAAAGRIDLRVHDYFDDVALWDYLESLDVSVLPYRFGTHSGWLEACRDLGTTVVAPSCGYYAEQGPVLTFDMDERRVDLAGLAAAVTQAHRDRPDLGAGIHERREQRARIAVAHDLLYRSVIAR